MTQIPVQPDLFGGESDLPGFHRVIAHTRMLDDGTEVFVGEHLRWNRGRTTREGAPRPTAAAEPIEGQVPLFPVR